MFAAALSLAASSAHAAGLGKINVLSALGQPLNAEVEIVQLQPGEEEGLAARLPGLDAFTAAGIEPSAVLTSVRLSIQRRNNRPYVKVTSLQAVDDPFLEMLIGLGKNDMDRAVGDFEAFADNYRELVPTVTDWTERVAAIRDGLADAYVTAGRLDQAERLFKERHSEDTNDVAVALSASRAFLQAGSVSHAVRWLGVGAARAASLGRTDLADRLRQKQDSVRKRLS